jgi:hypothetical protein
MSLYYELITFACLAHKVDAAVIRNVGDASVGSVSDDNVDGSVRGGCEAAYRLDVGADRVCPIGRVTVQRVVSGKDDDLTRP